MTGNYFNSSVVVPLVKASAQHAAFTDGDVVFDWTSFDIPKGTARLVGTSIQTRHNKVASQVAGLDLIFAKDDGTNSTPATMGTANAFMGVTNFSRTDVIGFLPGGVNDLSGLTATAATYQTTVRNDASGPVLESSTNSGTNVGYDRYYVGGLANGDLDLQSLVETDDAYDVSEVTDGVLDTLDGTACNLVFAIGDVIHAEDDIILGEIGALDANSITFKLDGSTSTNHSGAYTVPANLAAYKIQNGGADAGDLANNDMLYNVFPIRIILHFSR